MSDDMSEYNVYELSEWLAMPSSDRCDWHELRKFLAEHAPGSDAHRAIEAIVILTQRASRLLDAICYPPPLPPPVEGVRLQYQVSPLDAVARVRGSDEGLETALPTILKWKIPDDLKEIL